MEVEIWKINIKLIIVSYRYGTSRRLATEDQDATDNLSLRVPAFYQCSTYNAVFSPICHITSGLQIPHHIDERKKIDSYRFRED